VLGEFPFSLTSIYFSFLVSGVGVEIGMSG
jgi:hypothetical protein